MPNFSEDRLTKMYILCDIFAARLDLLCVIPLGQLATHRLTLSKIPFVIPFPYILTKI